MAVSIARIRQIMGEEVAKQTDEQIEEIIRILTVLSNLAIDDYLAKRNKKRPGSNQDIQPLFPNQALVKVRKRRRRTKKHE